MKFSTMTWFATSVFFLSLSAVCHAEESEADKADLKAKIEMHEKMAEAHKKAVECLKSGKSHGECHEQMLKAMPDKMTSGAGDECPMMKGAMKGMKGKHDCKDGNCRHKKCKKDGDCKDKNKKCKKCREEESHGHEE